MEISFVITAYREPLTIGQAIEPVLSPNKELWDKMQLIVVAPDQETLEAARNKIDSLGFKNSLLLKDNAEGKPAALNLAYEHCAGNIIFLSDGDMYISNNSIKDMSILFKSPSVGGTSGHPVSLENRGTMFGYFSHLFCEAAHQKRLTDDRMPMSGYLYAIRKIEGIFPLPVAIRAEDAYITHKILDAGYLTVYSADSKAWVRFPKTLSDWLNQKIRSLGGNVQLKRFPSKSPQIKRTAADHTYVAIVPNADAVGNKMNRNVLQDIHMTLFPLKFAQNAKEVIYSLALYPLRLYLWIVIYQRHILNRYSKGAWQRIESSKI